MPTAANVQIVFVLSDVAAIHSRSVSEQRMQTRERKKKKRKTQQTEQCMDHM